MYMRFTVKLAAPFRLSYPSLVNVLCVHNPGIPPKILQAVHFLCFAFPALLLLPGFNSHCIPYVFVYFTTDEDHSTVIGMSGSVFLLVLASMAIMYRLPLSALQHVLLICLTSN